MGKIEINAQPTAAFKNITRANRNCPHFSQNIQRKKIKTFHYVSKKKIITAQIMPIEKITYLG
jgi:hypothetical protein